MTTFSVKNKKWSAAIASASLLSLGLAACSGTSSDDKSSGTSDGEATTITYLHRLPDGEGMTPVADIVAEWNEANPDVQVKATKFDGPASEMILKLETDINAGAGPCLAQLGYAEIPDMFVKGLVTDVSAEAKQYEENFSAGAFGMMRIGDAVAGLPQDTGPLVYYYNADAFTALGLEVPTNLADFQASAATAADAGKYIAAFTPDEAKNWLSGQAAAAGDTWFSSKDDEWVVTADGEGSTIVADFWQSMIDGQDVLITQRWGDAFTQSIVDGQLIGHVGAAWEAGFLLDPLDGTPAEGQWRVAQLPDFGAGAMTGPDGGSGVAVMKGCENPEAAMKFNNWFNTQVDALASQGLVVAANGKVATPEKMARQFGGQDVVAELGIATSNLNPDFAYAPGFSTLEKMNEVADKITAGGTVAGVFTTAQTSAVEALKSLGLPVAE